MYAIIKIWNYEGASIELFRKKQNAKKTYEKLKQKNDIFVDKLILCKIIEKTKWG